MSAQHTPGPWQVREISVPSIFIQGRGWSAWILERTVGDKTEKLIGEDDKLVLFATEALAVAAIAKVTGSAA